MKRMTDIVFAAIGLIVLAPLFIVIAAALWLDDHGPILHQGLRIGRGEHPFQMLKFRTMHVGGELGSAITVAADTRVTRVGRVLRATKLDEIPQLINVLRGEMSLVGPRPESPVYVALYTPAQRGVLAVPPGITGPTQILFRHEEQLLTGPDPDAYYRAVVMPAKLAIDLEYARQASFWGDLKWIALTAIALFHAPPAPDLSVFSSAAHVSEPSGARLLPLTLVETAQAAPVIAGESGGGAA